MRQPARLLLLLSLAATAGGLACSTQPARSPSPSPSMSSPPSAAAQTTPAAAAEARVPHRSLRPVVEGARTLLAARSAALHAAADALRPWLTTPRCAPLPPDTRLVAARILSAPAGESPDAGDERSTVERPVFLHAELEVELADGRRETLRSAAADDDGDGDPTDAMAPCVELTWYKLEPSVRWHTNKDGDGRSHFTPVPYVATPFAHGWRTLADVHPTLLDDQFPELPTGVGVMHYQLGARLQGQSLATAGPDTLDRYGTLDASLPRVSYRPDTGSWVDYTFELFNTPYVWGSLGSQVDGQTASDCADLAVYAWRRAGHGEVDYTWSYGMRELTTLRAEVVGIDESTGLFIDADGESLTIGSDIEPGDLILLRRHIAVFYADADGDGRLGVDDELVQTNWHEPERVSFARMRYEHDAFEIRSWTTPRR